MMSSNISKETDSSATAENKMILQTSKPLIQLAVFTSCGIACGFAFEKARGINVGRVS